jgi:hypothetical protein
MSVQLPTVGRFDGETRLITNLVIQYMPDAAAASGLCSVVDYSAVVADALAGHGFERVSEWAIRNGYRSDSDLGVPAIRAYCEAMGLPVSDVFVKPFRLELIKACMRANSDARMRANAG